MTPIEIFTLFAIPSSITGLFVWWVKKKLDQQEERQLEREENQQQLMIMMMNSTKANSIGIQAVARAVQRIPDAHANGDIDSAIEEMNKLQKEEDNFLTEQGVKHILND